MNEINVYCDESCHLPNDKSAVMSLGAIWCTKDKVKEISRRIGEIKNKHGVKSTAELKWTKISPSKLNMYLELVDYFFDDDDLHFRGLIAINKNKLNHEKYNQSHDDWYYKMYFYLIRTILTSSEKYFILIDKKDTLGAQRLEKLQTVLSNDKCDFDKNIVKSIKIISSESSTCMQLADVFAGALCHYNKEISSSSAKNKVIERIKERSKLKLTMSTLPGERKFNLFIWDASPGVNEI